MRPGQRYLESVENPGDAKRNDSQCMETTPRQAVQSGRYIGFDNRPIGSRALRAYCGLLFGAKCHDAAYQGGNAMRTAEKRAGVGKDERISPRERILSVASDLFYRHGIRAIGVDTIAEAAETNKMTLYRHFSSKDDLVAGYLRRIGGKGQIVVGPARSRPSHCSWAAPSR